MRLTGDRSPIVLPGQRRYARSRPPVAGPGLRPGQQLVPALVVRWVPWSAARLAPPLDLVLGSGVPIGSIMPPMGYGTDAPLDLNEAGSL